MENSGSCDVNPLATDSPWLQPWMLIQVNKCTDEQLQHLLWLMEQADVAADVPTVI